MFSWKRILATAAILILAGAGVSAAAIVVRRPGPPLPKLVPAAYFTARPVVWIAPPPPRLFVAPVPRPGWVWSPGYWRWTGRAYIWADGVWLRERPGLGFVPAHWERFPGGWRFVPGGWIGRPL